MSPTVPVTGLIVLAATADNKLRMVPLTGKQSARVRRFITTLHGGSLHLDKKDLLLMTEADAMAAFEKLTGKVPMLERLRRAFDKLSRNKPQQQFPPEPVVLEAGEKGSLQ